ncbi:MAG: hypothetical protein KDD51_15100 [Bdellovibrionales bacterium]|nr:hypothetical protein [Bdellovibrionales bacterium]
MKVTAWILILVTMGSPSWAYSLSLESYPTPVGILSLNELEGRDDSVALSRIERSIEKWLDRLPIDAAAHPLVAPQSDRELHDELVRLRLNQLWERFYSAVEARPEQATSMLSTLEQPDVLAFLKGEFAGPFRQQAFLARAALEWRMGRKDSANSYLKAAVYEHPMGLVPQIPEWGWDGEVADSTSMEQELSKIVTQTRRPCRLHLSAQPSTAQLSLNGFSVESGSALRLLARENLYVRAEAPGYQPQTRTISCKKLGVRGLGLTLAQANRPTPSLARVASENSVKSLLVITPSGEQAKIFLLTPGLRVDEVPTSKPLLLADFQEANNVDKLPIATDGFSSLVEAHRVAWLDRRDPLQPAGAFANQLETQAGPRWYNDWKVWAVVGGILGGVLVAYFATQRPQVQTNPAGLRISID